MGLGDKISQLLEENNLNVKQLADETGISASTLYSIIKRNNTKVDLSVLQEIADVFSVKLDYFSDKNISFINESTLTLSEKEHIKKYRHLDNSGKETVDFILDKEYKRMVEFDQIKEAPYIPETIAAHHVTGEFSEADKSDINRFLEIVKKNSNK